jgi:uncharacterized protein YwqG
MDREQAVGLIRANSLLEQADAIIEQLLPSARIRVHDDSGKRIEDSPTSHFGGLPSLPRNVSWPVWDRRDYLSALITRLEQQFQANPRAIGLRDIASRMRQELSRGPLPLLFLGQLALSEIAAAAPLSGWPREGNLVFFHEPSAWGFDPLARGHCRVLFFGPHEELAPVAFPKDLPDEAKFPQRKLSFVREWTLPTRIHLDSTELSVWGSDDYRDLCWQLMSLKSEDEPIHRCGGHPQEIQGEMRLECQLVTNGIYCGDAGGYRDPRRSLLEKGAADWELLLQVDSDEERLGWMWGDVGRVYFWARRQDIEAANFDGAWAILQCY